MTGQEAWIQIFLAKLEASTGHECLAHCVDHLEAVLLAQAIEAVKDFFKKLCEVASMIALNEEVKFIDFHPEDRGEADLVLCNLLPILDPRADDA